ncbi:hypothetical protein COU57_04415 [Candidatus Pacearchaeota archaeon CG10_big_fil_rev_8_21_14_0_10_32_14]|nr:MAG: hypothetical protein COU57_04415 [Candidatus Pacearchaeota archaeon CG10_big_fil_rev_8_21_14_0_10_32_14]
MEYYIINESVYEKVKARIASAKKDKAKIVFTNNDDEFSRKILEKLGNEIDIYLINLAWRRDMQKQREAGFNQVIAKICAKANIVIGINFDEIIESRNLKEKSEILGRIRQTIKLCNKNKLKMKFIILKKENERNIYDLKSLGLIFGMPTWMTSNLLYMI